MTHRHPDLARCHAIPSLLCAGGALLLIAAPLLAAGGCAALDDPMAVGDDIDDIGIDDIDIDGDSDGAGDGIGSGQQELICGGEDWNDLRVFSGDAKHRVGAQYARATASIPGCSASLVGPAKLLTANHCYNGATTTATFGMGWSGEIYARWRLRDLGLSQTQADAVPTGQLTQFTCTREMTFATSTYGHRDVDVYDCAANWIDNLGWVDAGDIWGYLEAQAGSRNEGTDTYVLSVNKASFYTNYRVLLSPNGDVNDEFDGCITFGDYDNCFEHDADTQGGSSGGAILDGNNRVFGVVHGHYDGDPGDNSCPTFATNYGAYLYSSGFETSWVVPDPLPSPSSSVVTPWVGGSGGSLSALVCPTGYLAAGVVGTTYGFDPASSARMGNFGLVCVPYVQSTDPRDRPTSQWRVLAGGSYDTALGAWSYDFNEYMHETLDLYYDGGKVASFWDQEQSLTMCKPGYYLTGLRVNATNLVDRVVEIECSKWNRFAWQPRQPRKALGTVSTSETLVRCPDTSGNNMLVPDRAVYGLRMRSGWLTDGFELFCRRY